MKRRSSFLPTRLVVILAVVALVAASCGGSRTAGREAVAVEITLTELKISIDGEVPAKRTLNSRSTTRAAWYTTSSRSSTGRRSGRR